MSPAAYACNHTTQCTIHNYKAVPGELSFTAGSTIVARKDTKLLYAKQVYNFELETDVTTAHSRTSSWQNLKKQPTLYSRKNMSCIRDAPYGTL